MRGDVNRGSDLGVQRRVTVAVAPDHLTDVDPGRVTDQRRGDRPAFESGVRRRLGHGVEVIEYPDRVPRSGVGGLGDGSHRLVLLDGVGDLGEVHAPTLRYEYTKAGAHLGMMPFSFREGDPARTLPIAA
jgi:hypothetical protein